MAIPVYCCALSRAPHGVAAKRFHDMSQVSADAAGASASALPLLQVRDVAVHFGGIVALDGVSFDVPEGAILGLIGPNGRPVPAGVAVEVATEVQTQQSNSSRYSNNVHHALRNHLNLQASYDGAPQSGNITRFASTEQLEMPSRRRLFIPDSFDV